MKKYEVWIADLNPQSGTEPGKIRPVVVVQTNLLNGLHPSTLVCPCTTQVQQNVNLLRVHLSSGTAGLAQDTDVLVDQIRAIDNRRFVTKTGEIPVPLRRTLDENLRIVLDV